MRCPYLNMPTLDELEDFTLKSYVKLLKYLDQIYTIVPFCDVRYEDTPYLVLRHDIDISLQNALTMAKIEEDLNIRSTYFVLFSSRFYNVFEAKNMEILKGISELGHEIGLHYYPKQYRLYKQNPQKTLQIQTQILENFLGKKVRSISRHGQFDMDPFSATRRYINANHPYLRADLFVHDSDRAWVTLEGLYVLLNNPPKRAQLLIHPENWQKDKIDREKLLERHFQTLENEIQEIKKGLFEIYRTDQLAIDYDNAIKNAHFNQLNYKSVPKNRSNYNRLTLLRYYLTHTKIGWNLKKLREKIEK